MVETRYVIYLTGKIPEEYISIQNYLESKNITFKKPSLGMHCTVLRFYSVVDEHLLVEEFNKLSESANIISTQVQKIDTFASSAIVLKLDKTSMLDKLHRDSIKAFNPYEILTSETRYVGPNYNPHLTIAHVQNNSLISNSISKLVINKNIILDTLVLVKKEVNWKVLAEKKLL